jgi:hypothetical protein
MKKLLVETADRAARYNPGIANRGVSLPKTPFLLKRLKFQSRGVQVFAAGGLHDFDIKFMAPVRWKHAGSERQLSLLTVRPVAYQLRRLAPLSYCNPAYLITTDPTL